eukprot:138557-Ditylum_brightwellii.AAC.1
MPKSSAPLNLLNLTTLICHRKRQTPTQKPLKVSVKPTTLPTTNPMTNNTLLPLKLLFKTEVKSKKVKASSMTTTAQTLTF